MIVHGIVQLAFFEILCRAFGIQHLCEAFIVGVVVEVAHDDDFGMFIDRQNTVGQMAAYAGRGLARPFRTRFAASAGRPVTYHDVNGITVERSGSIKNIAGEIGLARFGVFKGNGYGSCAGKVEIFGLIQQPHIDAALVRRIEVDDFVIAAF